MIKINDMNRRNIALILAGGSGSRLSNKIEKQLIKIESKPILVMCVETFLKVKDIDDIVVVCPKNKIELYKKIILPSFQIFNKDVKKLHIIEGGNARQRSSLLGVEYICKNFTCDVAVIIHDSARPFVTQTIIRDCIFKTWELGNAVTCVKPKDSFRYCGEALDREMLLQIQTPQGFKKDLILRALNYAEEHSINITDDASALDLIGEKVNFIDGSYDNYKVTTREDVPKTMRVGSGFDVHKLEKGRKFILGGIEIESPFGMVAHSDGDVLVHAIMDSLLGASSLGDIGRHFPDSDMKYKNISSMELLKIVKEKLYEEGWEIINIDSTVICEKPKLSPYIDEMRKNIVRCLELDIDKINIKATTTEKLGYIGKGEGIASESTCLIQSIKF